MIYEFFPEARDELFEGAVYYEAQENGLGVRFRNEVESAIQTILHHPFVWRERGHGGHRRYNLSVFPYYLAYFVEGEVVLFVAVAHAARDPNYWENRRQKQ